MQTVVRDVTTAHLLPKSLDATQVELQRQIDKLNDKVSKGKDHEKIIDRIAKINEDIALVQAEHKKERDALKTWGMTPKTWKWIGGGATGTALLADLGAISSNIPLTVLTNTTLTIIAATSVTAGVAIGATFFVGIFTYGQYKVDKRLDVFDQKVRQNELLSIFLNSYQAFMDYQPEHETSHENLEDQVAELKKCVENLKKISSFTVPQEAKDHWLSTMIQKLPDDDERKKRLVEQKTLAAAIEERQKNPTELVVCDTESEQPEFLKTTRADQAADSSMPAQNLLREKYEANLNAMREEFGMNIQELHVDGYKFNANARLKKMKIKPHVAVNI